MAEEIVTIFKADVSQLEAAIDKGDQAIEGYEKRAEDAAKSTDDLGKAAGNASGKVQMLAGATQGTANAEAKLAQEGKKAAASQVQLGQAADTAQKKMGLFGRIGQSISNTFGKLTGAVRSFGQGARQGFDDAVNGGGQAGRVIGDLGNSLKGAVGNVGGLAGAFTGLAGPIGIAAAAVAGFIANFSRLDSVKVSLEALGNTFDLTLNRLANLDFKGLFDPRVAAQDARAGIVIAEAVDAIDDAQLKVNKTNRDAEVQLAGLNQKLRDRTKTEEERLAIADQITSIEGKRVNEELSFIEQKIKAQALANAAELNRLGEVSDAKKLALSELLNERARVEAQSISLTETVERRRNSIIEQGINERSAAEQKAAAAREKAAADAEKAERERQAKAAQVQQLEGEILKVTAELDDKDLKEGLSALDVQLLNTEQKFQTIADNIKRSFAGLRTLAGEGTPQGDTPEGQEKILALRQKEAEALRQINTASQEAQLQDRAVFAAKELELVQETQRRIAEAVGTGTDIEAEQVKAKYAELLALAEKNIEDQETLAGERAKLIVARESELADIQVEKAKSLGEQLYITKAAQDEAELQLIRDKFEKIREEQETFDLSEQERAALNQELRLQEDQELFDAMQAQKVEQDEIERERQEQMIAYATDASQRMADLIAKAVEDGTVSAEEFGKQLVLILLDTLEKILLIKALEISAFLIEKGAEQGGLPGAIIGAVAGAVIVGALQAAFAAVKSAVAGSYHGEEYVGEGESPIWQGRDGYMRRLHKGERVITADKNEKHWEPLQAIHEGRFDKWMKDNAPVMQMPYLLESDMDVMKRVNRYMDGDFGQRVAASVMFPKGFDRNLVKSHERTNDELHTTNMLLAQMLEQGRKRNKHARSW